MKLFGRNASDRPATTDVPPELQPYYESNSPLARLGRRLRRALPLITLIVIVGAIAVTAGLWWQHRHKPTTKQAPSSQTQTPNQQVARNPAQPHLPVGTPGSAPSTPPASNGSGSSGAASGTTQNPSQQAPKTKSATPRPAPARPVPIPNTGPGDMMFVAAAGMALAATLANYRRQLRRSETTK